ncbi:hypothetical protein E1L24_21025 [Salmonella enterica subsp. enterica serovar Braenderup]|nr:hypothetical protein [Salmonella enterica subsp. enterica serovar Braenderup]
MDTEFVILEKLFLGSVAKGKIARFTWHRSPVKHAFIRRLHCEQSIRLVLVVLFEDKRGMLINNQRFAAEMWATTSGGEEASVGFANDEVIFEGIPYLL